LQKQEAVSLVTLLPLTAMEMPNCFHLMVIVSEHPDSIEDRVAAVACNGRAIERQTNDQKTHREETGEHPG
jgi:hypothetical protein